MNENLNPEKAVIPAEDTNPTVEETTVQMEPSKVEIPEEKIQLTSKDEILEAVKNILLKGDVPPRAEVESLKNAFYKLRHAELEEEKKAFIEAGNEESEFTPSVDPSEDVLKTYLAKIKEKRAAQIADEERLKEENYKKKLVIIESLKQLTESTDDFNKLYKEFKDLQHSWSEMKLVPQAKEKELWTAYQVQVELFYDLIKINNEFRDYDFKKNLESKIKFCEAAEKLVDEADAVSAFYQLQNYHKLWREVGPVAKELREELWTRFKNASTTINKKYQQHFESLKGQEEENLSKKTAICEKLKTIDYGALKSFKEWNEASKMVVDLQAEWRTIGFVPRKVNTQIFEEFRGYCDVFFAKKSEFFKDVKDDMEANLEKKKALCERAKALKDCTEWKKTTDELIAIQKEWKTIGAVPRKHSDVIWKEFVGACDYFFEQKKKNDSQAKGEELANLEAKKAIIEQINNIDQTQSSSEVLNQVRTLSDEWHKIGFVPFKEKDKCYKVFHKAVDAHYDRLKIDKQERRMEAFMSNIEDASKSGNASRALSKEREHLLYQYNKMKSDLQNYENNMSFLSISSKGANSLLKDVNKKIESLRTEMEVLAQKMAAIDAKKEELK